MLHFDAIAEQRIQEALKKASTKCSAALTGLFAVITRKPAKTSTEAKM